MVTVWSNSNVALTYPYRKITLTPWQIDHFIITFSNNDGTMHIFFLSQQNKLYSEKIMYRT